MDGAKKAYPVKLICKVMGVSRSGYYAWRKRRRSKQLTDNEKLIPMVREIHKDCKGTYGTRRIARELQDRGIPCGRSRARTLMRLAGVSVKKRRKFRVTTHSKHNLPVAPNLLGRQFSVSEPNRIWAGDITYVWTVAGWLYLAVVMDLHSRQIIGWAMSERITKKLVMDALQMAIWRRRPAPGLLFHSDRGSQYCSHSFQRLLAANKMICSMSRKGNCWDNAVVEKFFGTLKTERVFFCHYRKRNEARADIMEYIEMFYNAKRRHSYLGYVSPKQFEEQHTFSLAA